ncbi:MAG: flagellar export protein FliJ, partial [Hyphomicrobiales bacterium]|nr:flagellar export protein FliJ [Hyphomicrobiales bacterium]
AYSTFAKAAAQRRDNLRASILDLKAQLEVAQQVHSEAADELARAEAAEPREADRGGRGKSKRTSVPL